MVRICTSPKNNSYANALTSKVVLSGGLWVVNYGGDSFINGITDLIKGTAEKPFVCFACEIRVR